MAGESPDRSKQRESSAEPTSGSAIPVPEPSPESEGKPKRDPRLAVARETTKPSPGGVDTATRVLSRGELEAVRARLGGAGESEAGGSAAEDAEARADVSEGARAQGGDAEDVKAGAEVAEGVKAQAGDAEDVEAQAGDVEGVKARADDAEAETEDAEAPEGEGAEAAESDDAGAGAGKGADGAASSDDRLKAAVAAWVASADTEDEKATQDADGAAEGAKGADDEGASQSAGADVAEADAEEGVTTASGAAEPSTEAEDSSPKPSETAAEASSAGKTTADASEDAGTGIDAPDGPSDTDAEATTAEDADTAPADSDASAPGDSEDAAQGSSDPREGEGAPQDAPAPSDAGSASSNPGDDAPQGSSAPADATPQTPPAPADGEDAPQGPPAPDDESGTGGAGGRTGKGDGAAEAVDQPTAIFKAVRPAKPTVDQPTTMLKAPRPEADPPSDAERTSKFVALKPDIRENPAPKAPQAPAPDVTTAVPQIGPERTTQQPLPPRPPLDLLAELTNTPPPPDTPVRTLIRRVKIWTPLVVLLVIVFAVVQAVRPVPAPALDLTAQETYTFEGGKIDIPWPADGQAALDVDGIGTFGSSGEQKPVPIASVAKVMTAYLILRDRPLQSGDEGPKIQIDQAAQDQSDAGQESTVDVTKGDSITQREALESILIASANNVARLLARWDAGSEKAFVEKMNAAAKDLGMADSTYTDPSGLNDTTVSTAVDQVKLAKAAMKFPAFREVAAMMSYDDYKGVNHSNWNQLVGKNNVVGIKTGTTTSALGNLVFAAKKEIGGETRTIIGAVVRQPAGGPENTILSAALDGGDKLIRAAQDALEAATILKKGDVVGYVDDGLGGRTPVVATKDVKAVGWSGLKVKLTFAPDDVPHTAKAGTQVGTLTVGDGTSGAVKIPVALRSELTEPGFTDKLTRIA
ncbi:D-alanyl-D-alanine carboxypeptidase [Streptomyces lanatus]|uniref:serine-type D-Ala-D-Ala carboxypeptidase n=1 Tax=Streptomyces lanatus TaxID=66900 RepID=A0ABV1XSH6_9ACTN|nr:D-alanyl-D-alanine carboxypeptidase [Streptomyces lanatus]GHH07415.1 D-alanyl-D-alanine carboxypeptidase [Streptomyces lanatus]